MSDVYLPMYVVKGPGLVGMQYSVSTSSNTLGYVQTEDLMKHLPDEIFRTIAICCSDDKFLYENDLATSTISTYPVY